VNEPELPEEAFAAALAAVPGVGPAALRELTGASRPAEAWAKGSFPGDVAAIWERHRRGDITVAWYAGPGYPARLQHWPDAPAVLFSLGTLALIDRHPTVALVGTRSPTRYGIGVAAQLGAELAALGVSVVSGLALGIDGAAHEGACASGAPPIAVVAGGLDRPYPARHARLWERVAAQGVIVSESPAGVGTERWRFPVRNRLIAQLSDVVVVVESRHRGGALHTVTAAAALGIPVGAVPGSIRSPASEGTNALLADGCFPVCGVADVLAALSLRGVALPSPGTIGGDEGVHTDRRPAPDGDPSLADGERAVFDVLSSDPVPLEQLVRTTGLEISTLCGVLARLAATGLARDIGGWWERT
jgi:DNA processing protein